MLLKRELLHWLAVNNFKNSAVVCQCSQTICASASKRAKEKFPQDALDWRTMLCAVVRQTHCSIARPPLRVKAIFSDA
jgi:hypothetical protein